MKQHFLQRSFPAQLIETCIQKALSVASETKNRPSTEPIPLILTFNPRFRKEQSTLYQNSEWLTNDEIGRQLLKEYRPMICYRRPRNLKDLLTHADVEKKKTPPPGNHTCPKRCYNCPRMICTKTVKSPTMDYDFQIRGHHTCQSQYIIYLIHCNECGIQYIGQTSNSSAMRMTAHVADIKKNKNTTVSRHVNSTGHSINDLKVTALTHTSKDLNIRLRHEEAIIYIMGTAAPSGLNVMT